MVEDGEASAQWYVERDGEAEGPLTTEAALALLRRLHANPETLVWTEGFDGWQEAFRQTEFAGAFPKRPPPLPVREATAAITTVEPPPIPASEQAIPYQTVVAEPFDLDPPPPPAPPGSPWSRYFARQIDLSLLGFGGAAALSTVLLLTSPAAYKSFLEMNNAAVTVVAVLIAIMLNAVVISLFGNSIGKRIFGLKAVPSDIGIPPNAFWIFRREFRVWFYGLAAGIPIIALFTMGANHKEVKAGRPARYDRQSSAVLERPISGFRRATGMIFALLLIVSLLAFDVWSKEQDREIAATKPWLNPVTRQTAQLPGGWVFDPANSNPNENLYSFSDTSGTTAVFLASEEMPLNLRNQIDLTRYGMMLEQGVVNSVVFRDRWVPGLIAGRRVLLRNGSMKSQGWPAAYAVWQEGSIFWRVMVVSSAATEPAQLSQMPLVSAVVSSVPKR